MTKFRFTIKVSCSQYSEDDFTEWVASEGYAAGHTSRDGHHLIDFAIAADSLKTAVSGAAAWLSRWNGLEILGCETADTRETRAAPQPIR